MLQPNPYDKTVSRLFGLPVPKGEIGIEVEVEGTRLPGVYRDTETGNILGNLRYYWSTEGDGSLRSLHPGDLTAEYVLREPAARGDLAKVLDYFAKKWVEAGATTYNSYRTSVHVHLNVADWPMRRVYSFLTTYFILEEVLTEFADGGTKARVANRFCLRAKDAEFILSHLNDALKQGFRHRFDLRTLKYGAVNIAAVSKYGSLEFRALRGTVDTGLIKQWVNILLAVKDFSFKFDNPSDIISVFSQNGPDRFINLVLGDYADLMNMADLHNRLYDGMRLAQDVGFATNWQPYVEVKEAPPKKVSLDFVTIDDVEARPFADLAAQVAPQPVPPPRRTTFNIPTGGATWGRPL